MPNTTDRVERQARLKWVPIPKMRVSPVAQRDLNTHRVDRLAADFDLEQLGTPTVSERDGHFFIIDGQHRIEALKVMGWSDQQVQCWCYSGLTEEEEAETFLKLNDYLAVQAYDRYRIAVQAGREDETDIDRIVRALGLCVSRDDIPGRVRAVGTLKRVYQRGGPVVLARTLKIIRDAYGDPGMEQPVIDGIGHLCTRYNGELDDGLAVQRLANLHGGVNGLLGEAEKIRNRTGSPKGVSVAAAAVDVINRGNRGGKAGKKLSSWWKQ